MATVMHAKDSISASLAECFVTIESTVYKGLHRVGI